MDDVAIVLDHRCGALAAMGEALGSAGISIEGGGVFAVGGKAIGHFLFDDGAAAAAVLRGAGIRVTAVRPVIALRLRQAVPGQLGRVARLMASAGVSIEVQTAITRTGSYWWSMNRGGDARSRMRGRLARRRQTGTDPDIAGVASLIAEPARARMLAALMNGQALTATELAVEAGVAPSTASAHLGRLERAAAVAVVRQGRHRYYRLTDPDLAAVLERLMGLASQPQRRRGPVDPELRLSRVCFDHLAGAIAVQLADAFRRNGYVQGDAVWDLSPRGERFFISLGIDVPALAREKRLLVRPCLDWSERRFHLAGGLGAALLRRMFDAGWAYRESASRIVTFSEPGERWVRSVVSAGVARAG